MKKTTKKVLFYTGLGVDIALTIFLFVLAIIMLATYPFDAATQEQKLTLTNANGPFIGYLQNHATLYFWVGVFPLFVLLALNIVVFVLIVKKASKKPEVTVSDLDEATKAALKEELLKDLQKDK